MTSRSPPRAARPDGANAYFTRSLVSFRAALPWSAAWRLESFSLCLLSRRGCCGGDAVRVRNTSLPFHLKELDAAPTRSHVAEMENYDSLPESLRKYCTVYGASATEIMKARLWLPDDLIIARLEEMYGGCGDCP